jgi:hypothetical protein
VGSLTAKRVDKVLEFLTTKISALADVRVLLELTQVRFRNSLQAAGKAQVVKQHFSSAAVGTSPFGTTAIWQPFKVSAGSAD